MNRKTLFWGFLLGAAIGQSLVVWLAPKYLVWYFAPPAPMGFDCTVPISWALSRMQSALVVGLIMGAVVGLIGAYFVSNRFNKSEPNLRRPL